MYASIQYICTHAWRVQYLVPVHTSIQQFKLVDFEGLTDIHLTSVQKHGSISRQLKKWDTTCAAQGNTPNTHGLKVAKLPIIPMV